MTKFTKSSQKSEQGSTGYRERFELLKTIETPEDLRKLPRNKLQTVGEQLRSYLLDVTSRTGRTFSSRAGRQ